MFSQRNEKTLSYSYVWRCFQLNSTHLPNKADPVQACFRVKPPVEVVRAIFESQSQLRKKIAYWICTFSNNQYRVKEVGGQRGPGGVGRWQRIAYDGQRFASMIISANIVVLAMCLSLCMSVSLSVASINEQEWKEQ